MEQKARVFYQEDCDLSLLYGKTIAVIGYGSPRGFLSASVIVEFAFTTDLAAMIACS